MNLWGPIGSGAPMFARQTSRLSMAVRGTALASAAALSSSLSTSLPSQAHSQAKPKATDPPAPGKFKLALIQLHCGNDKPENIQNASAKVREAAAAGAQLISLPECFNSPYGANFFPEYAEPVPASMAVATAAEHPTTHALSVLAKELKVYLVGGSYPERDTKTGKLYNTCVVFGPDGSILTKHRKMHLFDIGASSPYEHVTYAPPRSASASSPPGADLRSSCSYTAVIDIPGKMTFFESETLTGGDTLSLFDTPWGRVGLGICYDIRFPQLAHLLREQGAHLLIYPGAFNTTTGPLHWELLARARAVDNQAFVATPSPARNPDSKYQAWGHTSLISPWGKVVAKCEEGPSIVYADVDLAEVLPMRQAIQVHDQKRDDLYTLKWSGMRSWLSVLTFGLL